MAQQTVTNNHTLTAVEWLAEKLIHAEPNILEWDKYIKQAKQIESDRRKEDFKIGYNQGFLDAQLNHVNDADNLAEEYIYLNNTNE
jgi:hypothetical protein